MGGQEDCGLGLFSDVSQNLVNSHSQCFMFPVERMDGTYFRPREIMHINRKKGKRNRVV